jgi:hypothetical protein
MNKHTNQYGIAICDNGFEETGREDSDGVGVGKSKKSSWRK